MEQDGEEKEFQRLWRKRQEGLRGIIVVTGPPYTRKTELADLIGAWAKCPALCIQHVLPSTPSDRDDEVAKKNAVDQAFTSLCKVAQFHLSTVFNDSKCFSKVVIKSRLSSTFELQRLFQLATCTNTWFFPAYPILFIECRFTNEYRWRQHFESARQREDDINRWYRPGSWEEMDKATRDYDSQSRHLVTHLLLHQQQHTTPTLPLPIVLRRLVVDPDEDIFTRSSSLFSSVQLLSDFRNAIKYLLTTPQHEIQLLLNINPPQHNHPSATGISSKNNIDYVAVALSDLRPHLFEKRVSARLAAFKGRRTQTYCPKQRDQCVFKLYSVDEDEDNVRVGTCCGVCGEQVVDSSSTSSYYACRLCILTLHKPCAERLPFNALHFSLGLLSKFSLYFSDLMPEKHACKSCSSDGEGTGFDEDCGACQLQTHLKCGLLPTIIHHNAHPSHFLSLLVTHQTYRCRACGEYGWDFAYLCRPCGLYYHLKCALLPLQLLRHHHGGHEHVMRLLYSHHDTDQPNEEEESYWCDVCGNNMDPHDWCYSCQDCPYYSAHLHCSRGYEYLRSNVKNSVFIPQLQSQLEAAMADVNSADSETPAENN